MLISECDDQGRFDADAQSIKWKVCQNVGEIGIPDIPALLSEMVTEGMLVLYGDDNQWGQVVNWWPHQPMAYARPSKFPPPEGWTDRIRYRQGSETWIKRGWDEPGGFAEGYELKIQESKRKEGMLPEGDGNVSESLPVTFSSIWLQELKTLDINKTLADEMDDYMDRITPEFFRAAVLEMLRQGKRAWRYCRGIIENCITEGRFPGEGKGANRSRRGSKPELTEQQRAFEEAAERQQRERNA